MSVDNREWKLRWKKYVIGIIFLLLLHAFFTQQFTDLTFDKLDKGYASYPGDPTGGMHIFTYVRKAFEKEGISFLFSQINPFLGAPFGTIVDTTTVQNLLILFVSRFGNELAIFNILMFMGYFFSGINTFILTWYITRSYFPSLIASIIFAYCPFHIARQAGHLSIAMTEWIPLFFLSIILFYKKPSFTRALMMGFVFAVLTSLNAYYGFFGIITFVSFISLLSIRYFRGIGLPNTPKIEKTFWYLAPLWWIGLVTAITIRVGRAWKYANKNKLCFFAPRFKKYVLPVLVCAIMLPLSMHNYVYQRLFPGSDVIANFVPERAPVEINVYSTRILDYFFPSYFQHYAKGDYEQNVIKHIKKQGSNAVEQTTFIGFVPLALFFSCWLTYHRNRKRQNDANNAHWELWTSIFLGLTIIMFFASFPGKIHFKIGPFVTIKDTLIRWHFTTPIGIIYQYLPIFRAVVRASIFVQLGVSILSAMILLKGIQKFRPKFITKVIGFCVLAGLIFLDFWPKYKPFSWDDVAAHPGYQWIKNQPKDNIVVEYPLNPPQLTGYKYYYNAWFHDHPILNFLPERYSFNMELLSIISDIKDPNTINAFRELGVKHIIWNGPKPLEQLSKGLELSLALTEQKMWIYTIRGESNIKPKDYGNRKKVKMVIKKLLGFRFCDKPECLEVKLHDNHLITLANILYDKTYNTLYPPRSDGQEGLIYYKFRPHQNFNNLSLKYVLIGRGNYVNIYLKEAGKDYELIVDDQAGDDLKLKNVVLIGFDYDKEYELKVVLNVKSGLPWDSRVESIREYHEDTRVGNNFTLNVKNLYKYAK